MPERFHTGWNLQGYEYTKPPHCFPDWGPARTDLVDTMLEFTADDDDLAMSQVNWASMPPDEQLNYFESGDAPNMHAVARAVLRDDPPREPEDWEVVLESHDYTPVVFWLKKVICENPHHLEQETEPETMTERFIRLSLDLAKRTGEPIGDEAARIIAGQVHGGQRSSMYAFASSGMIDQDAIFREVTIDYSDPQAETGLKAMLHAVAGYVLRHGDRGPVENWSDMTTDARIQELIADLEIED